MFNLLTYIKKRIVHVPRFKVGDNIKYITLDLDGFVVTKVSTSKFIGDYYTIEKVTPDGGRYFICGVEDREIELS